MSRNLLIDHWRGGPAHTLRWRALHHCAGQATSEPGRKLDKQFQLAVYGICFLLFYHWSGSLLATFAVQQCIAVLGIAYEEHWDFAEVDEPFFFSLAVFAAGLT